ncbi:MAG: hypothetical protein ACW99F_16845 [Candidatus Hodarchaeales archaeon]|jgi:hypothetical protein
MKKRRKIQNKEKYICKKKSKNIIIWFLLFAFVSSTVYLIARNVSSGGTLAQLEEEEAVLLNRRDALSHKLFEKSSLIKLQDEAEELGYTKPQDTVYIRSDDTVAAIQ